jgi:2-amino-4-hydroxy-6-hydroxymethyldihydropteridine diphosphokinase
MDKINVVFLSVGTNLGIREENIKNAKVELNRRVGLIVASSQFYYSDPIGFNSNNQFCNICLKILTEHDPFRLLDEIHRIELDLGRRQNEKGHYQDRIIDIDIIFFNNLEINAKELTIPHPKWKERAFVTVPLAEIV